MAEPDFDSILDAALDDFAQVPPPGQLPAAAHASVPDATDTSKQGADPDADSSAAQYMPQSAAPSTEPSALNTDPPASSHDAPAPGPSSDAVAQGASLPSQKFDPLARKKGSKKGSDAAVRKMDDMAEGLARLLQEIADAPGQAEGGRSGAQAGPAGHDFTATLQRMAQVTADAADGSRDPLGGQDDRAMAGLLDSMRAMMEGEGPADGEGEGDMNGFVEQIMHQLLSKDVLYEPLKEIGEQYPDWLDRHAGSLQPEERDRYERQLGYIQEICGLLEEHGDSKFPELMELLQQMQALGQPPAEIVEKLSPDSTADGGFPLFPGPGATEAGSGGCATQ